MLCTRPVCICRADTLQRALQQVKTLEETSRLSTAELEIKCEPRCRRRRRTASDDDIDIGAKQACRDDGRRSTASSSVAGSQIPAELQASMYENGNGNLYHYIVSL